MEYMEGWEKHSHVWQMNSKEAGLTSETLFFSTSVIPPKTGSENTKSFSSRCVNLGSNSTIWSNVKTERAEVSAISTCKPKISKYLYCLVGQMHPDFQILICSSGSKQTVLYKYLIPSPDQKGKTEKKGCRYNYSKQHRKNVPKFPARIFPILSSEQHLNCM